MSLSTPSPNALKLSVGSVLLYVPIFFMPPVGFATGLFSTTMMLLYLGHDERTRLTDLITAAAAIALAVFNLALGITYFLVSVLGGHLASRFRPFDDAKKRSLGVLAAGLPILVGGALVMVFLPEYVERLVSAVHDMIIAAINSLGDAATVQDESGTIANLRNNAEHVARIGVYQLPGTFFGYAALSAYFALKIESRISVRPFAVRMPDHIVWGLIIGGFFIMGDSFAAQMVFRNTLIVYGVLYFLQGADLLSTLFERWKLALPIRLLIYFFIFSQPPFIISVSLIGLFSIWIRFPRSKETPRG